MTSTRRCLTAKTAVYLALPLLGLALSGCLSGSSDSSNGTNGGSGGEPDVAFSGVYSGTSTDQGGTYEIDVLAYDGVIKGLSFDAGALYEGTYPTSGNNFEGMVDAWEIGGSWFALFSLDGEIDEDSGLEADFEPIEGAGGTGSLSVERASDSDRNLTWTLVSGTYGYEIDGHLFQFTISVDGSLEGGDSIDCSIEGEVDIPEENLNIMELTAETTGTSCLEEGTYSGLATLQDDADVDVFTFAASGPDSIYVDALPRR